MNKLAFDKELVRNWDKNLKQFNKPFKYYVIDNFLPIETAENISDDIPQPDQNWKHGYENFQKNKKALRDIYDMPFSIAMLLMELNGSRMLNYLSKITGIKNLLPDNNYSGGGIHVSPNGGYLKMHADYLKLPDHNINRKLNLLIYFNKDWKKDYGGYLEFWDKKMSKAIAKTEPSFNRCVIFHTDKYSYHGFPDKMNLPKNIYRRSLALYYYQNNKPLFKNRDSHYAIWKKRKDINEEKYGDDLTILEKIKRKFPF